VTTRVGDRGDTTLLGAARVRKTDLRIEALGDLDEAQSALGLARALVGGEAGETILALQRGLYLVMAEVSVQPADAEKLPQRIEAGAVDAIDTLGAELGEASAIGDHFVVPGENLASAALDMARTVVRRAERRVVRLVDSDLLASEHVLPWLNRLSDVLFILARAAEPQARPAATRPRARRGSGGTS
jgi:cob(I)alamin adenosyltransferase